MCPIKFHKYSVFPVNAAVHFEKVISSCHMIPIKTTCHKKKTCTHFTFSKSIKLIHTQYYSRFLCHQVTTQMKFKYTAQEKERSRITISGLFKEGVLSVIAQRTCKIAIT